MEQTLQLQTESRVWPFDWHINILLRPIPKVKVTVSQGQGHAHFDREYLAKGDRLNAHYYCQRIISHVAVRLKY